MEVVDDETKYISAPKNYREALNMANVDDKMVLLHFTDSTQTPFYVRNMKKVLTEDTLKSISENNLIFVEIDLGKSEKRLLLEQNHALKLKYGVGMVSTFILLNRYKLSCSKLSIQRKAFCATHIV